MMSTPVAQQDSDVTRPQAHPCVFKVKPRAVIERTEPEPDAVAAQRQAVYGMFRVTTPPLVRCLIAKITVWSVPLLEKFL
jgi:hypothetical protein